MADHQHGKMGIEEQRETYDLFWTWSIRVSAIVAVLLLLLVMFLT
ncbi:MAG: aa3-type cytochrome c oxidase subunit IV [Pseudomonadota bacterium]